MYVCSIASLVGLWVSWGQSLAISIPMTGDYNQQLAMEQELYGESAYAAAVHQLTVVEGKKDATKAEINKAYTNYVEELKKAKPKQLSIQEHQTSQHGSLSSRSPPQSCLSSAVMALCSMPQH